MHEVSTVSSRQLMIFGWVGYPLWRHANIRGNEMADRLAKEAAKAAEEMTDDIGIASQSDVKSAARESVNIKWQ